MDRPGHPGRSYRFQKYLEQQIYIMANERDKQVDAESCKDGDCQLTVGELKEALANIADDVKVDLACDRGFYHQASGPNACINGGSFISPVSVDEHSKNVVIWTDQNHFREC